jgi:methylthioribose-1-phosphate isomerase
VKEAEHIYQEDVELCRKLSLNGAGVIEAQDQILTHCNTGGLATAGVGTALGAVIEAHRLGKNPHVYVDETRPLLQGARLTTWELGKNGIPHTLICDNMAGYLMQKRRVQRVLVGADRIALNGDFANKIGTYTLAVLCHRHDIPFFVVAPQTTVDLNCADGGGIPVEERDASEVRGSWTLAQTEVWNPAFDVTPHDLVTGWVLDHGVFSLNDIQNGALRA